MHEHTQKHIVNIKRTSDRNFGLIFSSVFILISLYPLIFGRPVRIGYLSISGIFLLFALFLPGALTFGNRLWQKFGEFLHHLTSPLALGIVFYIVIFPTGLLMRIFINDPLRLRIDPNLESYWIKRNHLCFSEDSFKNQF